MNENLLLKGAKLPAYALLAMLGASPLPMAWTTPAVAQTQQIVKGTVIDDLGEPVLGASVVIVGTTNGTITDLDGNFSLNVKPGAELKISFVGYETLTVKAQNGMTVQLRENSTLLQDVEVVAYGVQKKVTMTGAVASVKSADLVKTSVGNVNNVLGGQLSGVTTVQYSGEPGSDAADIFVRGKATWGDSSPLIQVDGVERSMNDIDPNEIESISVLKDASATAVFGVRGANGVVLITTKRGQEGKAKISASSSFSALTPTKMVEQASSLDYALFYNQMKLNDWNANPENAGKEFAPTFLPGVIQKFKDGSDPIRFPSTRWADYIMKDVTLQQQHNLNISGGNDKVKYFISTGFYSQGGLFQEFGKNLDFDYSYKRFNYRANLDLKATKTTTISFNVAGNLDTADKVNNSQGTGGVIKTVYYATPFSSPGVVNGMLINTTDDYADGLTLPFVGGNGLGYYTANSSQNNNNKLQMDLVLDQKLDFWAWSKGLSFKAKGAYNSSFSVNKIGSMGVASYNPIIQPDGSIAYRKFGEDTAASYTSSQGKGRDWYVEASLNYNRSFGKHTVTALALYNQSKQYYYGSSFRDVPRSYVGFVGRVTYDWANRYMAEFNVGYNGSENFAPDKRFGTFPAGSLGWNISEESWWEPIKNIIGFMKLRASVGLVGNDKTPTGSRFMYLPDPYFTNSGGTASNAYVSADDHYGYLFGVGETSKDHAITQGAVEQSKNNPDVTWETALKQDYGVDMHFIQDKLSFSYDYYYEHRNDILLQDYTVPGIIGFTMPFYNLGETESWGHEFTLKWNDKIGDVRYWVNANVSYNQNRIIEMKEAPQSNAWQYAKDHRIGARSQYVFWKYYEGTQTETEYMQTFGTDYFPTQVVENLQPGDCVYVDLDKDGKINGNDASRDNGYTDDPEWMAGGSVGFSWNRLTFNCQFTGAWNVSRQISDVFRQPFFRSADTQFGGLLQYHVDNTWTPGVYESQDALYPRATWDNAGQNYAGSNLYEKDSKYLRLKTLSIGYDLINNWMKKTLGLTKCELSLSGYNLLTWTPYTWGDPEARASSSPSYPLQRTYTATLNINF